MDRDQVKKFLQDRGFGAVDDHRYHKIPGGKGVVVETCSWGPQYTPKQTGILRQLQTKILEHEKNTDMASPLQRISKAMAAQKKNRKKSPSVAPAIKKKAKPRPKPKNEAQLRRELAELKKLSRAQLRASRPIIKQAYLFLDKMAAFEVTTKQLETALAVRTKKKAT